MIKNDSLTTVGLGNNSISCAVSHRNTTIIVFISDLHFDYTSRKYKPDNADKWQEEFINYVKENCKGILCLAGDFFDNYEKTLSFIKKLEENRIVGFFVLGNHDYWNDGTKSHDDIIRLFDDETQNNNYFHLLITGKKYHINDAGIHPTIGYIDANAFAVEEIINLLLQKLGHPSTIHIRTKRAPDVEEEIIFWKVRSAVNSDDPNGFPPVRPGLSKNILNWPMNCGY